MYVEYGRFENESHDAVERAALARVLRFTLLDLAWNQQGRLTPRQRLRLLARGVSHAVMSPACLVPAVVIVVLLDLVVNSSVLTLSWLPAGAFVQPRVLIMIGAVAAGIGLLLSVLVGWLGDSAEHAASLWHLAGDAARGEAACFTGRFSTNCSGGRYYLRTGPCRFEIGAAAYHELNEMSAAAQYTFYSAPRSAVLLAMEPVLSIEITPS